MSTVTSKELDWSDPDDVRLADLFYSKSRSHVQALMQLVRESRALEEPAVDVSSVPKTLLQAQLRLLPGTEHAGQVDLARDARAIAPPSSRPAREHPLPHRVLCGQSPQFARCHHAQADPPYNLFVRADWATAKLYVDECDRFVARLHAARVVHGDLYVSNISWRQCSGVVEVKIMDWDTAFFIDEHVSSAHVPENLRRVWQDTNKWKGRFGITGQVQELDLFMIRAMKWSVHDNHPHALGWKLWLDAASATSAGDANVSFRELQALYLRECNAYEMQEPE